MRRWLSRMQIQVSLHPSPRISAFDTRIAGQTYLFQPALLSLRHVLVRICVPKAHRMQDGKRFGQHIKSGMQAMGTVEQDELLQDRDQVTCYSWTSMA
jgi:hypothetical protein